MKIIGSVQYCNDPRVASHVIVQMSVSELEDLAIGVNNKTPILNLVHSGTEYPIHEQWKLCKKVLEACELASNLPKTLLALAAVMETQIPEINAIREDSDAFGS